MVRARSSSLLGGSNNFEVDRQAAEALLAAAPDHRESARDNRRLLRRAVRMSAERGIRQFLDVGAGLMRHLTGVGILTA